jgi:hypothetical protein
MAEFVVKSEGYEDKIVKSSTPYAAAHRYAESSLKEDALDEDEFTVEVIDRDTGKMIRYIARAEVTTHWVLTRDKSHEEEAS